MEPAVSADHLAAAIVIQKFGRRWRARLTYVNILGYRESGISEDQLLTVEEERAAYGRGWNDGTGELDWLEPWRSRWEYIQWQWEQAGYRWATHASTYPE